jgi:hypothetical protein
MANLRYRRFLKVVELLEIDRDDLIQEAMDGNVVISFLTKNRQGTLVCLDYLEKVVRNSNDIGRVLKFPYNTDSVDVKDNTLLDIHKNSLFSLISDGKIFVSGYEFLRNDEFISRFSQSMHVSRGSCETQYGKVFFNNCESSYLIYVEFNDRYVGFDDLFISNEELKKIKKIFKNESIDDLREELKKKEKLIAELESAATSIIESKGCIKALALCIRYLITKNKSLSKGDGNPNFSSIAAELSSLVSYDQNGNVQYLNGYKPSGAILKAISASYKLTEKEINDFLSMN